MTEFLLELFSEEIPARLQEPAAKAFAAGISAEATYTFSPRYIIITADLPDMQSDEIFEKRGPRLDAPEKAIEGYKASIEKIRNDRFAEAVDLGRSFTVAGYNVIEEKGVKYHNFQSTIPGEPTKDFLAKKIPEILGAYSWPKSMRWGEHDLRWVRPLHAVECEFGGELVEFNFAHIHSSPITNHSSLITDQNVRKKIIVEGAKALHAGVELDENLLDEVNNLVENPVPMMGEFDASFLDVPQECLVTSMKSHQKYFPIYEGGKLLNKFIFVANLNAQDGGAKIRAGNERVLKARLSDAKFFWDQDRKHKLEDFLPKLKLVTFHNKIGNMYEKAERISALSGKIAKRLGVDVEKAKRAGLLCKADLVSEMVGEFADLQGLMGGYYADDAEIGEAIKAHYGEPSDPLAICVALADKFDSLTTLWAAGEKPTGSRDPFALRRAALGIVRIILDNNLKLSLREFVQDTEIFTFFTERLKYLLKADAIRHDVVDAVLGQGKASSDDLLTIYNKAGALTEFLQTDSGAQMLAAYKRATNILQIEEKKGGEKFASNPLENLLQTEEEKSLFTAIADAEIIVNQALETEDYSLGMTELAKLQPFVDAFFDNVIVNADAPEIRANRLRILAKIREFMELIADFSKIEG
jgi:glycyl-tRNA synthetase beta chain